MKTISVLIAAHQAQHWLDDCLGSVFAQHLPEDWQMQVLLAVDGCEETLWCALKLDFPELNTLHIQNNVGTYVAFNTLMRCAAGELICRFDADDVMLPDYLAEQITMIESGVDLTRTWNIYTDENLQPTAYVLSHDIFYQHGGYNRIPSDGQFVVKREVLESLGGFRSWRCAADTDFANRLKLAGFSTGIVEQHLYYRRTHRNSLTAHPDSNYQSSQRRNLQRLIKEYEQEYRTGKRALKIKPETAKVHAHEEIWHKDILSEVTRTETLKVKRKPGSANARSDNKHSPMLVVLDIDETLLHATPTPLSGAYDYASEGLWVYKRPYVDEFLNYCQNNFLVGAWTSANARYANQIFSQVFPYLSLQFIYSAEHCLLALDEEGQEVSIKPLKKLRELGFELNEIVMIDDSPEKHRLNPYNLLAVKPYRATEKQKIEDQILQELLSKLDKIKQQGFMPGHKPLGPMFKKDSNIVATTE